jgi:uncharacterized membrane protein
VRWLRARLREVAASGDDGQLILLILIYTVIAGLLVTVVVDVSKVYLYRRSLVAAADGAALSAANQPDLASVYDGAGSTLPLSSAGTESAVRQYARDAEMARRFEGFQIVDVTTDGSTVMVTFGSRVRMPFLGLLPSRYSGGYPVHAVARATSPLVP